MGCSFERAPLQAAMLCIMMAGCGWLSAPQNRTNGELADPQNHHRDARSNGAGLVGSEKTIFSSPGGCPKGELPFTDMPCVVATGGSQQTLAYAGLGGGKETVSGLLACHRVSLALSSGQAELGATIPETGEEPANTREGPHYHYDECVVCGPKV